MILLYINVQCFRIFFFNNSMLHFLKAADCPANSHFTQCSNNCANTCASLGRSVNCPDICVEGCQCDEGWLSDGDACVPVGDCGCFHNGKYLKVRCIAFPQSLIMIE